jgi:ribose transport system permease protein
MFRVLGTIILKQGRNQMSTATTKAGNERIKTLTLRIRSFFAFREAGILLVLVVLCIILSLVADRFLTVKNLTNVARQFSVIAIMSVGMTYVIITAGIDLSVGSVVALSGCMSAWYLVAGYPIWLCILIGLFLGALTGLVNGLLIVKINLAPFIATLGTMGIARGVVLALTMGYPIQPFPEEFQFFGRGNLGPIPIPVVIMTVIVVLGQLFLSRTTTGRYIYYVGSNPTAARLSGLNVGRILIFVYTIAGLLAGLSAVVLISRLTSAQSNMGMGWELDAIAAVVIGGTSLAGGEGSVLGSLIGAALMGVIKNALILLGVNVYWQSVVIGMVIVLAVGIDAWRQKRRAT